MFQYDNVVVVKIVVILDKGIEESWLVELELHDLVYVVVLCCNTSYLLNLIENKVCNLNDDAAP